MSIKKIHFTALLLLLPCFAAGQTYQTQTGHAEFTGHTPMFSFEGSSDKLQGKINVNNSKVNFSLPLKSLDTGNDKRNQDMMNVLNAVEYPQATFTGSIVSSFNPEPSRKQKVRVEGTFTVHSTSRTLEIPGIMQFENDQLKISASWPLKLTNFNMEPPNVLFYSMEDQIEVRIEASLMHGKSAN